MSAVSNHNTPDPGAGGAVRQAVFVRLTPSCTAMVSADAVPDSPDTGFSFGAAPAASWILRRFQINAGQQSPAEDERGCVLLLAEGGEAAEDTIDTVESDPWTSARPALLELQSSDGVWFRGPLIDGLADFAKQANPEWARIVAATVVLDGVPRLALGGEAEVIRGILRILDAVTEKSAALKAVIPMSGGIAYVEGDNTQLGRRERLFTLEDDQIRSMPKGSGSLSGEHRFALLSTPSEDGGATWAGEMLAVDPKSGCLARLTIPRPTRRGLDAVQERVRGFGTRVSMRLREALGDVVAQLDRGSEAGRRAERLLEAAQLRDDLAARSASFAGLDVAARLHTTVPVAGSGVFLHGTLADPNAFVERMPLKTPLGESIDAFPHLVRLPGGEQRDRSRGKDFVAFVPLKDARACVRQVRLQLELVDGSTADVLTPVFKGDLRAARRAVLDALPARHLDAKTLERVVHPALAPLQRQIVAHKGVGGQARFGETPKKPNVSLVIPLYKEYGFIRHQVQAFAIDSDFTDAEVIYVLDSPEDREEVEALLHDLHIVYGVPLRLLVMNGNYGFAGACNVGALLAKGSMLLLFNSDVVPLAPGWLKPWVDAHLADPDIGISGARLLFADGSLQHTGMYFDHSLMPWWTNQHYDKGLPASTPRARISGEVPAVTAAAALIERKLYRRIGGLAEDYVIGDFEDSDLCLRVRNAGYKAWYIADAELVHFERVSVRHHKDYWGKPTDRYNGWLHSQKWDHAIGEVMSGFSKPLSVSALQNGTLANPGSAVA